MDTDETPNIFEDERVRDRIRIDDHKNVIFPHFNLQGLCGFELKNQNFTGFAPGAEKGLWGSRPQKDDKRLIISETAIDSLSYAELHGMAHKRFVSTAGALNPIQPELLARAMRRLSEGSQEAEIVLALDNDEAGDRLCEQIEAIYRDSEPADSILKVHRPDRRGEDWNDALRASDLI